MTDGYAWAGSGAEVLGARPGDILSALESHHRALNQQSPSRASVAAWSEQLELLQACLQSLSQDDPRALEWHFIFEYELPLEGGRRPDVVVLAGGNVIVLEFKSTTAETQGALDQVAAYARDLSEYHAASHGRVVVPVLVLPRAPIDQIERSGVCVAGPEGLGAVLSTSAGDGTIDTQEWLNSAYEPLPTLIAAARRIFAHEPLPHVRKARSLGIPEAVEFVASLVERSQATGKRMLVLVTGVPGAGKTLVGLRTVYEVSQTAGHSIFLSGNGPLVQVLKDALGTSTFVRDLHAFIKTYGLGQRVPKQQVIVFDEAQRAWDRKYMLEKRGVDASEPDLLIQAADRITDWAVLVGLVGEGQEIYSGEQAGLAQWREALQTSARTWEVHCGPGVAHVFDGLEVSSTPRLDLNVSLRSRVADEHHEWVRHVLAGSLDLAAHIANRIKQSEFPLYLTRDLEAAKQYARDRYDESEGTYGLFISSHAKSGKRLALDTSFFRMRNLPVAKWYNAPREDPLSGCALTQPLTEFQCQGLEVDLPIVVWGDDFLWKEGWHASPKNSKYPQEDPHQLLKNAYRVLLTRGRDGLVVVVPDETAFDAAAQSLAAAGMRELPGSATGAVAAEQKASYEASPRINGNGAGH